jgi:DNA-binding winged helix-turn-helix (wHTH) protein/Tol biopolymer transport system component
MGTDLRRSPKYTFGAFEADATSGELRKHGIRIRLSGQPFQILLALISKPGDVVAREELRSMLWQDRTFVDFDHSLNAAVNKLRAALGDSADSPRFIETLPGRGYRWIYPLSRDSTDSAQPPAAPGRTPAVWPLSIAAAVAFALLAGWWVGIRSRPPSESQVVQFEIPIPQGEVVEPAIGRRGMAVSPDGKHVAFSTLGADGLFTLWVRDLSRLDARPVPAGKGAHTLFWGANEGALYFSVLGGLKKWTSGDAPVQLLQSFPDLILTGAQQRDGRLLLSGRSRTYTLDQATGRVSSGGGSPTIHLQVLPGSDDMLFAEYDPAKALWRTRIGPAGSSNGPIPVEAVSHAEYAGGFLFYIRNGSLVAQRFDLDNRRITGDAQVVAAKVFNAQPTGAADFSVSGNTLVYRPFVPDSEMRWVDRRGRTIGRLGPSAASLRHVRLSPDGTRASTVIYEVERGESDAWVFDVRTGEGRRVTARPGLTEGTVFAPNGNQLAYSKAASAPPRLRLRELREGAAEEMLPQEFFQIATDWSRDGRFIAFTNTAHKGIESEREGNVTLIDLKRGRRLIPILNSPFHETGLVFSPDGNWIAYITNDSGKPEAYVHRFEVSATPRLAGERTLISTGGALQVRWAGDGRELFYLGMDNRVHSVRLTFGGPGPKVAGREDLFELDLRARTAAHGDSYFDVAPDGQKFLVPAVIKGVQPGYVVVKNWRGLLAE